MRMGWDWIGLAVILTPYVTLSFRFVKRARRTLIKDRKLPVLQFAQDEANAVAEPLLWSGIWLSGI